MKSGVVPDDRVGGILEKRGKWTWSERYFVLSATHLSYFKKEPQHVLDEPREIVPLTMLSVHQKDSHVKKNTFEIIIHDPDSDIADTHATASVSSSSHRHHASWVLKAKSREECAAWIMAIRHRQSLLESSPGLQAALTNSYTSVAGPSAAVTNSPNMNSVDSAAGYNTRRASRTGLNSLPPRPLPSNANLPLTVASPAAAATSVTNSAELPRSNADLSLPPAAVSALHSPLALVDDPIQWVCVEQTHKKKQYRWNAVSAATKRVELAVPEVTIGRTVPFGTPLRVNGVYDSAVIVATLGDGGIVRIPLEELHGRSGSKLFEVNTPARLAAVRLQWETQFSSLSYHLRNNCSQLLVSFLLPLCLLILCSYLSATRLLETSFAKWPLIDLRPLFHITDVGVLIVVAMAFAVHDLSQKLITVSQKLKKRWLKVSFSSTESRTAPHAQAATVFNSAAGRLSKLAPPPVALAPAPLPKTDGNSSANAAHDDSDEEEEKRAVPGEEADHEEHESEADGESSPTGGPSEPSLYDSLYKPAVHRFSYGGWTESDPSIVKVRGQEYMTDGVKIPAGPHLFRLAHLDLFWTPSSVKLDHVSARSKSFAQMRYQAMLREINAHSGDTANKSILLSDADVLNPLIVVNFLVPINTERNCNLVLYFTRRIHSKTSRKAQVTDNNSNTSLLAQGGNHVQTSSKALADEKEKHTEDATVKADEHHTHAQHNHSQKPSSNTDSPPHTAPAAASSNAPTPPPVLISAPSTSTSSNAATSPQTDTTRKIGSIILNSQTAATPHAEEKKDSSASSASLPAGVPASLSSSSSISTSVSALDDTSAQDFGVDETRLSAFDRLLYNFIKGDDSYRNRRLKIIPVVADGNWIAKKVVGGKPALLGQKIKIHYHRDSDMNYLECTVDLATSAMAGRILGVVNGQAAKLVVDVSFVIQGEADDELPEALLGGVRMLNLKLDKFKSMEEVGI